MSPGTAVRCMGPSARCALRVISLASQPGRAAATWASKISARDS
jgi:hypothetical protein